ncbi:MAG: hypothetical protein JST84_20445 [Acidobacteria bacterium]|nr:hypothetical protein [Acidobacteriota bacterium]
MSKTCIYFVLALLLLGSIGFSCFAQEQQKPFTKEELLRLLKPTPGKRVEQGELAGEIESRGIAFKADEATLAEFRKAGARTFVINAIQQAERDANRPKLLPNTPAEALNNVTSDEKATVVKTEPTLLEKARHHAEQFIDELPNFIVTQYIARSIRPPGQKDWQAEDKLEVELSFQEKVGEKFKLVKINNKPTSQTYENVGGATSTGEFGLMLAGLFHPQSQAEFKEVRKETFNGRETVLFEFRVKKANSNNQITDKSTGRSVTTAYSGTIWVEAGTGRVLRLEQSAEDIQRGFPITLAESAVEYDWVTIAGAKYLMPIYAEVIMGRDADRFYSRNVIELKNYRVFDTDVKMIIEK